MTKNSFLVIGILLCLSIFAAPCYSQKKKILFIGNSYTTYDGYNIPRKVRKLAKASGKKVLIRQHTKNGLTLQHHLENRQAQTKIRRHTWDYVILQEQSYTAIAHREQGMYPAVRAFNDLIQKQRSQTGLYVLMPKEYSPDAVFTIRNDSTIYYYRVFKDFAHAQDSLQNIHHKIACEIAAQTIPIGQAFQLALAEKPKLILYRKDRVHPSREGAYLIACVFYTFLFGESPVGNPYHANVATDIAEFLQQVAFEAVSKNKQ
jgi:hypothetical protein